MQQMMPLMRGLSKMDPAIVKEVDEKCPEACEEEFIDTDMSFTIVSEESHRRAWELWQMPPNHTKEDALFMELYFKTLNTEVTKFDPFTVYDLLSSIGGKKKKKNPHHSHIPF